MRTTHKIKEMEVKPETLENATEGSQRVDDWLQEMQNQPEQTPSQMETLAAEFDIFQPQTPQELQPQRECVEIHAKQPEETISQEEIFDSHKSKLEIMFNGRV